LRGSHKNTQQQGVELLFALLGMCTT
jgi:hypothetical protein